MNYFDGEFLKVEDFQDEQKYNIEMLKNHNKNLHSWGIAEGLEVEVFIGANEVTVNKGVAIDADGNQIIVDSNKSKQISPELASSKEYYLTIAYCEVNTDPRGDIPNQSLYTRIEAEPEIKFSENLPSDTSRQLILAQVTLDGDKKISNVSSNSRKYAGVKGDLDTESITLTVNNADQNQYPKLKGAESKTLEIDASTLDVKGTVKAITYEGDGSNILNLNAGNITNLNAGNLTGYLQIKLDTNSFSQDDLKDNTTATSKPYTIGFNPKVIMISGGCEISMQTKDPNTFESHGGTFSGFWANEVVSCSALKIRKDSGKDWEIYSDLQSTLFFIDFECNDVALYGSKNVSVIFSGEIKIDDKNVSTVTLSKQINRGNDLSGSDKFTINLNLLYIG